MISLLITGFPVILPMLVILIVEVVFLRALQKRAGEIQVFEIGVIFSSVILLYTVLPFLTFLANGWTFSPLGDARLFAAQPSPREIAPIYWYYFLFFASFVLTYIILRGRNRHVIAKHQRPENHIFWTMLLCYVAIRIFFIFVRVQYKIDDAEDYGESYLLYQGLPLFLQQLANHLGGMALTLQLLLMAFMVFDFKKYRFIILGWVFFEFLGLVLFGVGARTGLFALLFAFVMTYHVAVKRLSIRTIAIVGLSVLILFVGLGIVRALSGSSPDAGFALLSSSNEFDSIFANAYDLRELKALGRTDDIFPQFYFADFLNLIPQQLSPFQKLDLSAWYVESFYPSTAQKGGGLAFGVISEGIVGLGWFEILCRGLFLGWIFAVLQKYLLGGRASFWKYGFYLWLTVLCYQCFRGSTFLLLPRAFYQFLLLVVILKAVSSLLGRSRSYQREATLSGALQTNEAR
jgi:oligosaccharide repeat unit polymerase